MKQNYSGVDGAAIQDRVVQESMGPVYDRTQEHLGVSDKAVIFYRRLILRKLKEMEKGTPLPALDPALRFDEQRACSWYMPTDEPWQDVTRFQEQYELDHPLSVAAE